MENFSFAAEKWYPKLDVLCQTQKVPEKLLTDEKDSPTTHENSSEIILPKDSKDFTFEPSTEFVADKFGWIPEKELEISCEENSNSSEGQKSENFVPIQSPNINSNKHSSKHVSNFHPDRSNNPVSVNHFFSKDKVWD